MTNSPNTTQADSSKQTTGEQGNLSKQSFADPQKLRKKSFKKLINEAYPGLSRLTKYPLGSSDQAKLQRFEACLKVNRFNAIALFDLFEFDIADEAVVKDKLILDDPIQAISYARVLPEKGQDFLRACFIYFTDHRRVRELYQVIAEKPERLCELEDEFITLLAASELTLGEVELNKFDFEDKHIIDFISAKLDQDFNNTIENIGANLNDFVVSKLKDFINRSEFFHNVNSYKILKDNQQLRLVDTDIFISTILNRKADRPAFFKSAALFKDDPNFIPSVAKYLENNGFESEETFLILSESVSTQEFEELINKSFQSDPTLSLLLLAYHENFDASKYAKQYFEACLNYSPTELYCLSDKIDLSSQQKLKLAIKLAGVELCKNDRSDTIDQTLEAIRELPISEPKEQLLVWKTLLQETGATAIPCLLELDLTEQEINEVLTVYLGDYPKDFFQIYRGFSQEIQDQFRQELFNQLVKSDKYYAFDCAADLQIDNEQIYALGIKCIKSNTSETLQNLSSISNLPLEQREDLFIKASAKQLWKTLDYYAVFNIPVESETAQGFFSELAASDPLRLYEQRAVIGQNHIILKDLYKKLATAKPKKFFEVINQDRISNEFLTQIFTELPEFNPGHFVNYAKLAESYDFSEIAGQYIVKLNKEPIKQAEALAIYKVSTPEVIESVIFKNLLDKYSTDVWKDFFLNHYSKLSISDFDTKRRMVARLADRLWSTVPKNFELSGLFSNDQSTDQELERVRESIAISLLDNQYKSSKEGIPHILENIEKFQISDHTAIYKAILGICHSKNSTSLLPLLANLNLRTRDSKRLLIKSFLSYIWSNSLGNINDIQGLKQSPGQRTNFVDFINTINNIHFFNDNDRLLIYSNILDKIAKRGGAIDDKHLKQLHFENKEYYAFISPTIAKINAELALDFMQSHHVDDQYISAKVLLYLVKQNPKLVPEKSRLFLSDEIILKKVAIALGKKDFKTLQQKYIYFGLKNDQVSYEILQVLEKSEKCIGVENLLQFGITDPQVAKKLLRETASRDIELVKSLANSQTLLSNPDFLKEMFIEALKTGNLINLVKVSKIYAQYILKSQEESEHLRALSTLLQTTQAEEVEKSPEANRLKDLILKVCRSKLIPSPNIIKAFDLFDNHGDSYLVKVIGTAGPTFGEHLVDVLLDLYSEYNSKHKSYGKVEISQGHQKVLNICVQQEFRGVTAQIVKQLLELKEKRKSWEAVIEQIENWNNLSHDILTGQNVSESLRNEKLYYLLLHNAYKPVGISLSEMRSFIGQVKDHTAHLSSYQYPESGYAVNIRNIAEVKLKSSKQLDYSKLDATYELSKAAHNLNPEEEKLSEILIHASKRSFNSIDKQTLLSILYSLTEDSRMADCLEKIKAVKENSANSLVQKAYESLLLWSDYFGAIEEDILKEVISNYIKSGKIDLDQGIRSRITKNYNQNEPVTNEDIINYFVTELQDKIFRKDSVVLKREFSKFDNVTSTSSQDIRLFLSKSRESFLARAAAGLCTAKEMWSWNNKNFLQMIMVNMHTSRVTGNVQLHLFKGPNGPAVLARINPTTKFLSKVDSKTLADGMMNEIHRFASENNLEVYLPEQTRWHQLSNRAGFAKHLMKFFGNREKIAVQLTARQTAYTIYKSTFNPNLE